MRNKSEITLRPFEAASAVYAAVMLTAHLLYMGFQGFSSLPTAKRDLFYCAASGYVLAVGLMLGYGLGTGRLQTDLLRRRIRACAVPLGLMLVYLLLTLISALASPLSGTLLGNGRHEGFCTILLYVLSFCLLAVFSRPGRWMLYVFAASAGAMAVLCIIQSFGLNPLGLYQGGSNFLSIGQTHIGTIGNIGHLGALYCLGIPAMTVYLVRARDPRRFWLLAALAPMAYVLVRINVLAAFVGLSCGALLLLPLLLRFPRKPLLAYYAVLGLGLAAAVTALFLLDPGAGFFHELHEILHGRISLTFGTGRVRIWKEVLQLVPKRLWLGWGPDTMGLAGIPPFSRYDPALGKTVKAAIDAAHNEYLNILFHQGLPALLVYLAALTAVTVRFLRQARCSTAAAVLGAGVLCYLIEAQFGISQPITSPFFWLCLGLLTRVTCPADPTPEPLA